MMKLSPKMRDAGIIVGVTLVLLFLVYPRKKGILQPKVADTKKLDNLQNAQIILNAYINAVEAREKSSALNELNQEFIKQYGMKVVKNSSNKYVARTMDGKDVLMVK
jgi:hypothetical protein